MRRTERNQRQKVYIIITKKLGGRGKENAVQAIGRNGGENQSK